MLTTSFRALHKAGACRARYTHFARAMGGVKGYGRDTPIPLLRVLDENGINDALWAFRACGEEALPVAQEFVLRCAEHVQHIGPPEVAACNAVTRRYLAGAATREELRRAKAAAWNVPWVPCATEAAEAAAEAAGVADWDADWATWASGVARAARTAQSAVWAAEAAAASTAPDSERQWQEALLREMLAV